MVVFLFKKKCNKIYLLRLSIYSEQDISKLLYLQIRIYYKNEKRINYNDYVFSKSIKKIEVLSRPDWL